MIAAYGAAPSPGLWPPFTPVASPSEHDASPRSHFVLPPPLNKLGADGVRATIERLIRLRLSPACTDPAMRAELDSAVGELTIALAIGVAP